MQNWLKDNAASIIIAIVTLVSTYAVYGYRLASVEQKVEANSADISALQGNNTSILVSLARIQTDIEYIKAQLARIAN